MGSEVQSTSFQRPNNHYYTQKRMESPTVTGLIIMFIAEILIVIGYFNDDFLLSYSYYWPTLTTLGIIGIVLGFIGFMKIYRDRFSYQEPHPKNVSQALHLYILGIILSICPFVFALIFLISVNGSDIGFTRATFYTVFILSIVGPLLWIFGGYKTLLKLIPESRKILLKLALSIFIIAIVVSLTKFISIFLGYGYYLLITSNLTRNLYLISHIFFTICFYFAYDYQRQYPQLQRSEI